MLTLAKGLVEGMGGTVEFDIRRGYPFLKNNEELTERLQSEAKAFLGDQNVEPLGIWMAAEDFSYFTQEVPSCFYRLGTRNEAKKPHLVCITPALTLMKMHLSEAVDYSLS